jgi:hypothetical protein
VLDDVQPPRARGELTLELAQLARVLLREPAQLPGRVLIHGQDRLFRGRRRQREGREDDGRRARD